MCVGSNQCIVAIKGLPERFREHRHNGDDCVMHDLDTLLMARFASGEEAAFDELFKRNAQRASDIALRFIGDPTEAEDVAQDALLRVLSARDRWKPTAKFTTWLYKIVVNLCLKHLRKTKSAGGMVADFSPETEQGNVYMELPANENEEPEHALQRKRLATAVQEAVMSLPTNQRMAVILHRFEGLSYQEIAEAMGCSVSAVESLLHRAKQTLKQKLEPWVKGA
jgi:RNA polymerase sigma-70 factor (ECF subfamily)